LYYQKEADQSNESQKGDLHQSHVLQQMVQQKGVFAHKSTITINPTLAFVSYVQNDNIVQQILKAFKKLWPSFC